MHWQLLKYVSIFLFIILLFCNCERWKDHFISKIHILLYKSNQVIRLNPFSPLSIHTLFTCILKNIFYYISFVYIDEIIRQCYSEFNNRIKFEILLNANNTLNVIALSEIPLRFLSIPFLLNKKIKEIILTDIHYLCLKASLFSD